MATIELIDRETARYLGEEGQAEFLATAAMHGGAIVRRAGRVVEAIDISTLRWVEAREGELMAEHERTAIVEAIRRHYRAEGTPYRLRHPNGETEDETGRRSPGFRTALPRAEHSDGWSLTDLWLSPEFPDPGSYPPTVVYRDAEGVAELPRRIGVRGDRRIRLLDLPGLRWIGARAGEPMGDDDRARIEQRVRTVYDEWGYGYEIEGG